MGGATVVTVTKPGDAEKEAVDVTTHSPQSSLCCTLMVCATLAILSLCACIVLLERDYIMASPKVVVLVHDHPPNAHNRMMSDPFDYDARVGFDPFDEDDESVPRLPASSLYFDEEKGKERKPISEPSLAGGERFGTFDGFPPSFPRQNQIGKFLQALMNRPVEGFNRVNPLPRIPDEENTGVILLMSNTDLDEGQSPAEVSVSADSLGNKLSGTSQALRSPLFDLFNSMLRERLVDGRQSHEPPTWLPVQRQYLGGLSVPLAAVHYNWQELDQLSVLPELGGLPENDNVLEQKQSEQENLSESKLADGDKLPKKDEPSDQQAVEAIDAETDTTGQPLIAMPVMRVMYKHIIFSSPHSSSEDNAQLSGQEELLLDHADPGSLPDANKSWPGTVEGAEQEKKLDGEEQKVNEGGKKINEEEKKVNNWEKKVVIGEKQEHEGEKKGDTEEKKVAEGMSMPELRAEYNLDTATGQSKVNVTVSGGAEPDTNPSLFIKPFWDHIKNIFNRQNHSPAYK